MTRSSKQQAQDSAPQPPVQSVRATEIPPYDPSAIPPVISEFFRGRGLRISLASTNPREVGRLAYFQRTLLRLDDVPEEQRQTLAQLLAENGFRTVEGHFMRGDTGLYKQPWAKYEEMGWEAFDAWKAQQPDPQREADAIADAVDGSIRHGVRVTPINEPAGGAVIRPPAGTR